MTSELDILVEVPPEDQMGPAMRALNERQRRFVCAMSVTGGDHREAYSWAGYDTKNPNSTSAAASRLAANPDVEEAMKEEALRRLKGSAIIAVSTLVQIAGPRSTSKDRDKIAASVALLDRIKGFGGKVEHTVVHQLDEKTADELIDFIRLTAKANGLDAQKLLGPHAPVIDAEFTEVDPDLADLL
jgi:hypothetical protein